MDETYELRGSKARNIADMLAAKAAPTDAASPAPVQDAGTPAVSTDTSAPLTSAPVEEKKNDSAAPAATTEDPKPKEEPKSRDTSSPAKIPDAPPLPPPPPGSKLKIERKVPPAPPLPPPLPGSKLKINKAPKAPPPSRADEEQSKQKSGETRGKAMYRILVSGHKLRKEEDKEELEKALDNGTGSPPGGPPSRGGGTPSTPLTGGQRMRKSGAAFLDKAVRADRTVSGFEPFIEGAFGVAEGVADTFDIINEKNNAGKPAEEQSSDVGGEYGNVLNIASGLYGAARGTLSTLAASRNFHKQKRADRLRRNLAAFDIGSGVAGTVGGLTGISAGISGLAGGSNVLSGGLSAAANGLDAVSSGLGFGKNVYQMGAYGRLKSEADARVAAYGRKEYGNARDVRSARAGFAGLRGSDDLMGKRLRAELLREKLAQKKQDKAAAFLAKGVSHNAGLRSQEGKYGMAASGLKTAGSLLGFGGAISKVAGAGFGGAIAGMVMKSLGTIVKAGSAALENRMESKVRAKQAGASAEFKQRTVSRYLENKRSKIKTEMIGKFGEGETPMTDAEVDNVVLMRFSIVSGDTVGAGDITEEHKDALFKALMNRRVDAIMNAGDKKTILENMGLMETATKADILSAMGFGDLAAAAPTSPPPAGP